MLRAAFFTIIASVLITVLAIQAQVPLGSTHHQQDSKKQAILGDKDFNDWSLDKLPNPNATDHLVFETVHSLLQHWPNTRMRNGHTIVPGVIPKGTLLYHGGKSDELPVGPDWTATDPEHSYWFCEEAHPQQGCWQFTLVTTRPLNVVYFDGSSAAKMPYGTLDTQDLVVWGKFGTGRRDEDMTRIGDLCQWGKRFDIDGFVRMEMDFELMTCDFTSGLSVVSLVNLPYRGVIPPVQPGWVDFATMNAGSWHNRFPGETRVQLDLTRLISFYDIELVPSLVAVRASQERWDHRAGNSSSEDILAVKSRLEAILINHSGFSSGIDWKTLFQVIVDRFAGRLELTRHLLNSSATNPDEILDLANKTQTQLRVMLTPYLVLSAIPTDPSDKADLGWIEPVYKHCATTHTYTMDSELDTMTDSEKLLLLAVRGTSREICRVVTKMWVAGVYAGIDPSLNTMESPNTAEVTQVWDIWAEDLSRLMGWLDWNVWVKCNPDCGPEEMCYLPTWPVEFPTERRRHFNSRITAVNNLAEDFEIIMPDSDEWMRPQPKCVRRVVPYEF